jgi:small ligand-binding sensory domain FIST
MSQYEAALSQHPLAASAVGEVAGELLERLGGERPDLVVCFASPHHVGTFEDLTGVLRQVLEPDVLVGCTAVSVIGGEHEVEDGPAIAAWAARFDDATLTPVTLELVDTADGPAVVGWPDDRADDRLDDRTLLLLADPFTFPVDGLLRRLNDDGRALRVLGGLASSARGPGGNRLVLDDRIRTDGAVGVLLDADVDVRTVVSQGCRPVGSPFTVTRAEGSLVYELGGKSALERLRELAAAATDEERMLMQRGLHVGLVVDEHKTDFARGDFLVRNLLGAQDTTGAIAVGDNVAVGRTLQFHVRDASAADEDLRALLAGVDARAGLLFTCNGRGRNLFGVPDHDAGLVERLLGPIPLAGAFCAGEIGPVGGQNFLHGFTASLALFPQ